MKKHTMSLAGNRRAELVLALLLNFLLYHCAACTAVGLFYGEESLHHYLWMAFLLLPIFFFAFLRYRVKSFLLFLSLHMAGLFFSIFVGRDLAERLVLVICTIWMTVISIRIRTTERWKVQESPTFGMIAVPLLCHFLGYYMEHSLLVQMIYYEAVIFVILYLLHGNLKNTTDFIDINKSTTNFPAGQMSVINRILVVLFLAVLGAAMILFSRLHLETFLFPVLKGALRVIAWLFSLLYLSDISERMDNAVQRMSSAPPLDGLGASDTGLLWVVLEKILVVLVVVLLAAIVFGGIAYLLYRLYKGFYAERKENADEKEFLTKEVRWLPRELFAGKGGKAQERGSINQRVRKVYKRCVKKGFGRKETIPAALTPKELLAVLEERGNRLGDTSRIRKIYESARYSGRECTPEELSELKGLISDDMLPYRKGDNND